MGKKTRELPLSLLLIAFVSGACAMVVEIAGARIISPYLGNTIYTWASAIGLVLAALSAGYYAGGVIADRYHDRRHFSTILLLAGLLTLAVPVLGSLVVPFTLLLELSAASLVSALILVPASVFYGMVSPYVITLTSESGHEGRSAGRVFAVSTVGSIVGALGTGFVIIPNLEINHIFVLAALLMVAMSWAASGRKGTALFDLFPLVLLSFLSLQVGHASIYGGETIYEGDSMYYHIRVVDTADFEGGPARVLFLDDSFSTAETPEGKPAFDYVEKSRMAYELFPGVENALVLGIAGGTQVKDVKEHFPNARVDGVDIDREVMEIGKEYFSLNEDERTSLFVEDARRYVRTTGKSYDLVLVDTFRGTNLPYHLTTREFILELKEKMNPEGVVIVNVISSIEGKGSEVFLRVYSTFSSIFQNVIVVPVGETPGETMNVLLIATDKDVSVFSEQHKDQIYTGPIPERPPLTDALNPIELYVVR
jgi:spermidine synthase